ncbi:phospholipase A2, minor isoenzyme-like [Hypanus sabinus]|uniref:phospholipase A2, minor isoenzyme-like n=1 Tax=Hypanus sabinus TaxID=79690 RepID=UPI0028C4B9A2|nr:phospholipase A2, minor isoenzyme-like [Hypanus sabinus]
MDSTQSPAIQVKITNETIKLTAMSQVALIKTKGVKTHRTADKTIANQAVASASITPYALWQFRKMIRCVLPDSSPILDFNDYGCNCGFGGTGKCVDELDRCCLNHDRCYHNAKVDLCSFLVDSPYIELYSYSCSGNQISCSSKNDPCEAAICNCDRTAAICFSKAPYNPEYKDLDKKKYC